MKAVFLVDTFLTNAQTEELTEALGEKEIVYANTYNCEKENEYRYLEWIINDFASSKNTVLLVHFSGDEEVARELGDEIPEMIIPLITAKRSAQHVTNPASIIREMLDILEENK